MPNLLVLSFPVAVNSLNIGMYFFCFVCRWEEEIQFIFWEVGWISMATLVTCLYEFLLSLVFPEACKQSITMFHIRISYWSTKLERKTSLNRRFDSCVSIWAVSYLWGSQSNPYDQAALPEGPTFWQYNLIYDTTKYDII